MTIERQYRLARLARFERATHGSGGRCSVRAELQARIVTFLHLGDRTLCPSRCRFVFTQSGIGQGDSHALKPHIPPHLISTRWSECILVGARGFEPPTPCSQSRCATRLRHAPPSAAPNLHYTGTSYRRSATSDLDGGPTPSALLPRHSPCPPLTQALSPLRGARGFRAGPSPLRERVRMRVSNPFVNKAG